MVTRKELVAEVEALGKDLGEPVHTDRLNNAALQELVVRLRGRLEESTRPPAPPVTGAQRVAAEPSPKPAPTPSRPGADVRSPAPAVRDPVPPADHAHGDPSRQQPAQAPAPPKAPYYVARGQATVAGGRVVGPLREVRASDFARGQEDLDYLVLRGVVIRSGS